MFYYIFSENGDRGGGDNGDHGDGVRCSGVHDGGVRGHLLSA